MATIQTGDCCVWGLLSTRVEDWLWSKILHHSPCMMSASQRKHAAEFTVIIVCRSGIITTQLSLVMVDRPIALQIYPPKTCTSRSMMDKSDTLLPSRSKSMLNMVL